MIYGVARLLVVLGLCTLGATTQAQMAEQVQVQAQPPTRTLAFPTAEGFGRFTQGGRGGRVIQVTNLNTSGPGSLRACMEATGPRTCIFRVGGVIDFSQSTTDKCEHCFDTPPYLTIAGQTAPGDGIMIRGMEMSLFGTHNIIIRHLRMRVGNTPVNGESSLGSFNYSDAHDLIFDHYSTGWAPDDTIGAYGYNITFQWGLVTEGLGFCQTAPTVECQSSKVGGTDGGDTAASLTQGVSFLHNYFAHYEQRLPIIGGGTVQMANNVIYNSGRNGTMLYFGQGGTPGMVEIVNNYYVTGPNNSNGHPWVTLLDCNWGNDCAVVRASRVYLHGNFHSVHRPTNTLPETAIVEGEPPWEPQLVTTPFGLPTIPTLVSAEQAQIDVLARAGATVPKRDVIDQRGLDSFVCGADAKCLAVYYPNGAFDTHDVASYGGYPTYKSGTPYQDTDGDGMEDAWEVRQGLNPRDPGDGPRLAANGYTYLENFLNELAGDFASGLSHPPTLPAPQIVRTPQ